VGIQLVPLSVAVFEVEVLKKKAREKVVKKLGRR
jgi:hypothetical protein